MESVITTGLLAYGMSGKVFHAPFIEAHHGFKLRAITERTCKKASQDYPDIISYDSVDALLNDPVIDLVIINTPNNTHYEYAIQALRKGKHILVEKPFSATTAEAAAIFELARSIDRKVFVYQNRRWDSDFQSVKNIVDLGVLGRLNEVHIRFDRYRTTISPKTFKEIPIPASGIQYDLGPHLLDQVISLFGKPISFYKVLGKNRAETQVDDYFSIHLAYPNSLNVFVHGNMLVTDVQPAYVLHGDKGSFVKKRADVQEDQLVTEIKPTQDLYGKEVAGMEGQLTLMSDQGLKQYSQITSERGSYPLLFDAIFQCLTKGVPYPVKEEEIMTQIHILETPALQVTFL